MPRAFRLANTLVSTRCDGCKRLAPRVVVIESPDPARKMTPCGDCRANLAEVLDEAAPAFSNPMIRGDDNIHRRRP